MCNVHVKNKRVNNAFIYNLLILLTFMEKRRILNGTPRPRLLMSNSRTNLGAIIAYFKKKKLSY